MVKQFKGEYAWLSNFWYHDDWCVEKFFQGAKATNERDRSWVLSARSPSEAKSRGRQIKCRTDWEDVKIDIMRDLLRKKFNNSEMKAKLLATGNKVLEEGNFHGDDYWGIDLKTGQGKNMLGRLLMEVRSDLQEETQNK